MSEENTRSNDSHGNSPEFLASNYQKELNSRKFMRIANIADYFGGVLGYNISIFNTDFNAIKWKVLSLPLLLNLLFFIFASVNFFNEINSDIYEALVVLPPLVTALTTFVQRFRMFYLEIELKEIYSRMFQLWDRELLNGINGEIAKNARRHLFIAKLYSTVFISPMILYLLRPFSTLFNYYVLNANETFTETNMIPVAYPFTIDTMWKWAMCSFVEGLVTVNTVMLLIGNDLAFVQMCALLSLQIQVLGDKLQNISQEIYSEDNECRLVRRLLEMGKQHCELIELCHKIENAFNPGILAIMIGASVMLCACAIVVEEEVSRNNFEAAAAVLFHSSAIMMQTALYCVTADDISHWMENISEKIYESPWFGHSKRFQKMSILIMLRSNTSFKFKTYGLYNVDRVQLTKIMALAYNLIMALRNIRSFKKE